MKTLNQKTQALRFRVTRDEMQVFNQFAKSLNENRSSLLRKVVREMINGVPDLLPYEKAEWNEAIRSLGLLSRNLIQSVNSKEGFAIVPACIDNDFITSLQNAIDTLQGNLIRLTTITQQRLVKISENKVTFKNES